MSGFNSLMSVALELHLVNEQTAIYDIALPGYEVVLYVSV
jgi:hypothetical protein